jgi:hypothetical protein
MPTKAFNYMLRRWPSFTRFLEDGRICLTNNAAERALRGIATRESLCSPSLSICKHWKRLGVGNATRATFSGHRHFGRDCQHRWRCPGNWRSSKRTADSRHRPREMAYAPCRKTAEVL